MGEVNLDVLVAEHIFGLVDGQDFGLCLEHDWKRDHKGGIDWYAWETLSHMGAECQRCGHQLCIHSSCTEFGEKPCVSKPKPYSTSLVCAWEVIETATHYMLLPVHYEPTTGKPNIHRCDIWYGKGQDQTHGSAFAMSVPRAICVAALQAKGIEVW